MNNNDDELVRTVLRPVRGCATDSQYCDVYDRVVTALTTARKEAQAEFVNNIAAVLDADDVETFTALVMKAKQSPNLHSETRSALKSEAEIRKEARAEAFKEAIAAVPQVGVTFPEGYEEWIDAPSYREGVIAALEAAATTQKGGNDGRV